MGRYVEVLNALKQYIYTLFYSAVLSVRWNCFVLKAGNVLFGYTVMMSQLHSKTPACLHIQQTFMFLLAQR